MWKFPQIDPVALQLGPLKVRWYGLMYLIGFAAGWFLGRRRARQEGSGWTVDEVTSLATYGALGVILGGRIGHTLFYNFERFLERPLMIVEIWNGGMSFHGGFLGVAVAIYFFCRATKKSFLQVCDFSVPLVPIGLGAGRLGNFINGELYGRVSDVPWAMVFPTGGPHARHPSQLYEALLEGLVLFVILWWYSSKPRRVGATSGWFCILYGVFRFGVEFVREADAQIGYVGGWLTRGMILCIPLILLGVYLVSRAKPMAPLAEKAG